MRFIIFCILPFIYSSCGSLANLSDDVEKIADDNAITVKVNKEALKRDDSNVSINVEVQNKEPLPVNN